MENISCHGEEDAVPSWIVKIPVLSNLLYTFNEILINQNLSKLFFRYLETDFKIYTQKGKTYNTQDNIEIKEQN